METMPQNQNKNQFEIKFPEDLDKKGRTLQNVEALAKSLRGEDFDLSSIVYNDKEKQFYIENKLADSWIDEMNELLKGGYSRARGYE